LHGLLGYQQGSRPEHPFLMQHPHRFANRTHLARQSRERTKATITGKVSIAPCSPRRWK
jgi:hypothetical protein